MGLGLVAQLLSACLMHKVLDDISNHINQREAAYASNASTLQVEPGGWEVRGQPETKPACYRTALPSRSHLPPQ